MKESLSRVRDECRVEMYFSLILVGFFWGITNPFLKIGTRGMKKKHGELRERNAFQKATDEMYCLVTNWKYVVPFLVNQCGSLLYVYTLQSTDLTLAIPIANSISFVFTFIGGWLLGEESPKRSTILGMLLISAGISCYVADRLNRDIPH